MDTTDKSSTTAPTEDSPPRHGSFRHSTCGSQIIAAIVDRVTFNAHIIETGTESYRLRTSKTNNRRKGAS